MKLKCRSQKLFSNPKKNQSYVKSLKRSRNRRKKNQNAQKSKYQKPKNTKTYQKFQITKGLTWKFMKNLNSIQRKWKRPFQRHCKKLKNQLKVHSNQLSNQLKMVCQRYGLSYFSICTSLCTFHFVLNLYYSYKMRQYLHIYCT